MDEPTPLSTLNQHLARWAHAWAAAASQTYETIESISMPQSPATELGRRDAMTMVLVDAVRNVVRGAEQAVGRDSDIVRQFNDDHPTLKTLRDRFEHYEDYVRGRGDAQRTGRRRNGDPLQLDSAGIEVAASEGGGSQGHLVRVSVIERADDDQPAEIVYEAPTRQITIAVRRLAREVLAETGLLDGRHLAACEICADTDAI